MSRPPLLPRLPRAAPAVPQPRRSFLYRGLVNQCVCLVASVPFWLLSQRRSEYGVVLIYAFVIGNLIWLCIDGSRQIGARWFGGEPNRSSGLGWALTIVAGAAVGYALGTTLVDALLGVQSASLLAHLTTGVLTLGMAGAATYYFYSRERLHTEMAAAEAARRLALENQLKLLEAQLEPHMLFNTLANLRVLIGLDPPQAQAMLDRLIGFLRATLNASRRGTHPLRAEFDRLADYGALMGVRMGPRLAVRFDLPDDLRALEVPPLLLQPLVENAIKHGLEPKLDGGRLEVRARRQGTQLVLTVRDTGVGLAEAPPSSAATDGDATRYGSAHVHERLAALYGDRARFTLTSAPDDEGGAVATITLPLPDSPA